MPDVQEVRTLLARVMAGVLRDELPPSSPQANERAAEAISYDVLQPNADWLRLIAADLRAAGDVELVRMSEDGVTRQAYTLADELWLVALALDGRLVTREIR